MKKLCLLFLSVLCLVNYASAETAGDCKEVYDNPIENIGEGILYQKNQDTHIEYMGKEYRDHCYFKDNKPTKTLYKYSCVDGKLVTKKETCKYGCDDYTNTCIVDPDATRPSCCPDGYALEFGYETCKSWNNNSGQGENFCSNSSLEDARDAIKVKARKKIFDDNVSCCVLVSASKEARELKIEEDGSLVDGDCQMEKPLPYTKKPAFKTCHQINFKSVDCKQVNKSDLRCGELYGCTDDKGEYTLEVVKDNCASCEYLKEHDICDDDHSCLNSANHLCNSCSSWEEGFCYSPDELIAPK